MIDLTSKLGEFNDIEHNKGSKIYPQNQVILDCIMSSTPLKHKCLSTVQVSQCYYQMRPSELIRDEIAMVT